MQALTADFAHQLESRELDVDMYIATFATTNLHRVCGPHVLITGLRAHVRRREFKGKQVITTGPQVVLVEDKDQAQREAICQALRAERVIVEPSDSRFFLKIGGTNVTASSRALESALLACGIETVTIISYGFKGSLLEFQRDIGRYVLDSDENQFDIGFNYRIPGYLCLLGSRGCVRGGVNMPAGIKLVNPILGRLCRDAEGQWLFGYLQYLPRDDTPAIRIGASTLQDLVCYCTISHELKASGACRALQLEADTMAKIRRRFWSLLAVRLRMSRFCCNVADSLSLRLELRIAGGQPTQAWKQYLRFEAMPQLFHSDIAVRLVDVLTPLVFLN